MSKRQGDTPSPGEAGDSETNQGTDWGAALRDPKAHGFHSVLVTNPPMTTVASGCWTSAPAPVEMAIGMNPRLATSAVMSTGRMRVTPPSRMARSTGWPC